jgi:hypothetical protein
VTPAWTIALALLARGDQPAGADELAAPTGPVATSTETHTAATSTRIGVGILRAEGFDDLPELERAIRLRLPALTLVPAGQPAPAAEDGSLRAFIELRRQGDQVELTLILADGRAYLRTLEVDADAPARPAASALANLVAGIEDDSVTPDKEHVALPPALVAEPAPVEPISKPVPKASPAAPPAVAPAPALPRWELGPLLRFGGAFGLTPPRPGVRGAGPAVALEARAPSGLLLALDLQWTTRAVDRYHLQRVRVGVGVGYALRRGGFELPAALLVGIEPWWLGDGTGRVALASPSGRPGPLLGLGLRLSPGFIAPLGTRGARLRVGARVELWASGQADAGLRRPELRLPPTGPGPVMMTTPSASLGGLELQLGLEVGVWLPVGPGRERRSRRTGR